MLTINFYEQEFIDLKNKVYELNDENENLKRINKEQQDEINLLVQENNRLTSEVSKKNKVVDFESSFKLLC